MKFDLQLRMRGSNSLAEPAMCSLSLLSVLPVGLMLVLAVLVT